MTPKGSFFGPKNVFNRFMVKNRPNVLTFMKTAPATFFQRTIGLVRRDLSVHVRALRALTYFFLFLSWRCIVHVHSFAIEN